jgi:DNA-binding NarL/FixJ family response regulator
MRISERNSHSPQIALHVVEGHPLAARELALILRRFSNTTFHSEAPVPLESGGLGVLVVDAGTLAAPLGELLRSARRNDPKVSVIVLDNECPGEHLLQLLFLGVVGFVAYGRAWDDLPRAIRTAAGGGTWMPADVVKEFGRQRLLLADRQRGASLTDRELTVLGLVQRRLCNKEIASTLGVSVSTVKFHLENTFAKLRVHDRSRAADEASRRGMPELVPSRAS